MGVSVLLRLFISSKEVFNTVPSSVYMSRNIELQASNVRKRIFGHVRPAKIQISLCVRILIAKDPKFIHASDEDWTDCTDAQANLSLLITKTRLYNFDPANPTFINWGLQGYTLFFLFLLKNVDCVYSLEPPRRGGSNEYPQSMFWAEIWKKKLRISIWKFSVFGAEIFNIFE